MPLDGKMLFDGWGPLLRTLIVGMLAYVALVVLLRVSGKRTLSKWNAFDFVVTIAIGSTLATVLLSKETSLAQGVLALGLLIALQFVITWLSVRSQIVRRWIKAEPTLLLYNGRFLHDVLSRERIAESEVRAALRQHGKAALDDVEAVVLETDGSFSVIDRPPNGASGSALADVHGYGAGGSRG